MRLNILLLTVSFVLLGMSQSLAQSYQVPEIRSEVTISPDGTIRITEHLTYNFDGSYSWANYRLPQKGFSSLSEIEVSEDDTAYSKANTEETGTFTISENEDDTQIRWFYEAEDEQRTFTISYTLHDAVVVGPAWSEFFWNYISDDRAKYTKQLSISITLPAGISADSLHAWTRGPQENIDVQKSESRYSITAKNINSNESVKVRTVFPTAVFNRSEVDVTDADFSLAAAQQDEQNLREEKARQQERREQLAGIASRINYIIVVLSLFTLYMIFKKYGKRYSTARLSSQPTMTFPDDTPPTPIGWLLTRRTVSGNELVATILDLARQGYFAIREQPPEQGLLKRNEPTFLIERTDQARQQDLLDWEESVIGFVEKELNDNTRKLHEMLESVAMKSSGWFSNWGEIFEEYCYDQNWIDLKSYTGAYINAGIQLLLFAIGLGLTFYTGPVAPLSLLTLLLTTLVAAAMSVTIVRRTEHGEKTYHRWENYKKGLQNASRHNIRSDELDKHFVYAVALRVQGEELEQLFTSAFDKPPSFSWFTFRDSGLSSAAAASILTVLSTSALPSTSGGFTGASAGSAGGGASASAG